MDKWIEDAVRVLRDRTCQGWQVLFFVAGKMQRQYARGRRPDRINTAPGRVPRVPVVGLVG